MKRAESDCFLGSAFSTGLFSAALPSVFPSLFSVFDCGFSSLGVDLGVSALGMGRRG